MDGPLILRKYAATQTASIDDVRPACVERPPSSTPDGDKDRAVPLGAVQAVRRDGRPDQRAAGPYEYVLPHAQHGDLRRDRGFVEGPTSHFRPGCWYFLFVALLVQCGAWFLLVRSYRQLNSAKYIVIGVLEERLPGSPYWNAEWKALGEGKDKAKYWPIIASGAVGAGHLRGHLPGRVHRCCRVLSQGICLWPHGDGVFTWPKPGSASCGWAGSRARGGPCRSRAACRARRSPGGPARPGRPRREARGFGRDITVSAFAMMKMSTPVARRSRARRTAWAPSRASM